VVKVSDEHDLTEKRRHIAERLATPLWRWPHAVWDGEPRKHLRRIAVPDAGRGESERSSLLDQWPVLALGGLKCHLKRQE